MNFSIMKLEFLVGMKKTRGFKKKIKNSKVKFYIGDVRDYRSVSEAVKGVDYIFFMLLL